MRAGLPLILAASLTLAACQSGDDITPGDTSMSAAAAQQSLFTLVPEQALDNVQQGRLATIRGRASTASVHLARVASAPGQLMRQGSVLRVPVAPGVQVVAVGERVQQRAANDISWYGPVQGTHGSVQLVLGEGGVVGTVTVGTAQYSIEPLGGGVHAVSLINQNGFPSEHTPDNPSGVLDTPPPATPLSARAPAPGTGEVGIAATSTINVLVVYTASAATAAGSIASKIQLAVDETNVSYLNSGININMVRVHTAQVTYSESGRSFSQHVSALRSTTDGIMDNVHTLRNTYAADVVLLVVNDSEACGIA
jgi:peptidyl-Asp metalloendopeptidase